MRLLPFAVVLTVAAAAARAEGPLVKYGDPVPRDVREIYDAGLRHLLKTQTATGAWNSPHGSPAPTAMALMVLLASGEDPNFGPHRQPIRRGLRALINEQDANVGYLGGEGGRPSMYHHGFAMLGLAEAYGVVDDRGLWTEPGAQAGKGQGRTIGKALELAVRAAVTANKKNPTGGWHYGPEMLSADTSVSGAILMGLLAARNAGIEVPDEAIDRAIGYFSSMTGPSGIVGYSGGFDGFGESLARSSIATLVFSIAKRKDLKQYKSALGYIDDQLEGSASSWPEYARYYQAQALFQGNVDLWRKWNASTIRQLKSMQKEDGSFTGQLGPTTNTSMALLALALNYRFLPIYER